MQTEFVTTEVTRYDAAKNAFVVDTKFTSIEQCFELRINGNRFRKIFCSPNCIDDLAIGILAQAEKISSIDDVIRLDIDTENFLIDVETAPAEKFSTGDKLSDENFPDEVTRSDVDAEKIPINVETAPAEKFSTGDKLSGENFPDEVTRSDVDAEKIPINVETAPAEKFSTGDKLSDENFPDEVTRSDVDAEKIPINVETAPAEKFSTGDKLSDENFPDEVTRSDVDVEITSVEKTSERDELSDCRFLAKNILDCADKLLGEMSTTHAKTNGVHIGLLFDGEKILLVREDIGRHNVFDKIHGAAIREKIFLGDKVLIFSGRCSSEMMLKLWRMKIPVVAAKSVPTTHSIDLARKLGITLAARMAAGSFCIYTNPQRIVLKEG